MWRSERTVHQLFLLNVALQVFDGIATYQGLQHDFQEGNPLLVALMGVFGVAGALLIMKVKACGLLVVLRRYPGQPFVAESLVVIAVTYGSLSFFPWLSRLSSLVA